MSNKLLVIAVLLAFCIHAGAQTVTESKKTEEAEKLEKQAIELLRETSVEVGGMRSIENRISFSAELASLMWFHDPREAKGMYSTVIGDFKQLVMHYDQQMNNPPAATDDEPYSGGIFGGGRGIDHSPIARKFRVAMAVRQEIAMSLAEHDPDLAYGFYSDSVATLTNPEFRKQTEAGDKYFETRLIAQIALSDAAKAARYGTDSLKRGVDGQHIELLKKIYAKDPEKAAEFGAAIVSRLKSDNPDKDKFYSVVSIYQSLLSFGSETLAASKKPGGKKAVFSNDDLHDIADKFGSLVLEQDEANFAGGYYAQVIEKYSPGRAAQIRAKFRSSLSTASNRGYTNMMAPANAMMGNGYGNANAAMQQNVAEAAEREKVEKQMMEDVKNLGSKPLPKEEREKIIAQARKVIAQTPGRDKKITALSMLGAQAAKAGDKELAAEIMRDASNLVNPQPKNYQDFLFTWMLASGYAEADPDKAFPLLENTILRANDTLTAFIKVAEFIDINAEIIDDGEVQVGAFGGSMIRGLTQELGMANGTIRTLAKADFAKTRNLANTFDRAEIRVLAKMMVLRAVLDKKSASGSPEPEITNDPEATTDPQTLIEMSVPRRR